MIHELDQLKQLVFEGDFDQDSKTEVQKLEARLHKLAIKEKLAENPIIQEYIDYLQGEVDRAELLLKTDRMLTDRQRDALFARIDLAGRFADIFNGREREDIEKTIKELIHVAKTR